MSERQLSSTAMKHHDSVVELIKMKLCPKQIPCLIPTINHRGVRRIAKLAGLTVLAGRHMQDTKHHLRDPDFSPAALMAFNLIKQRQTHDRHVGAEGFIEIVRTIENILPVTPPELPKFLFVFSREVANNIVFIKVCPDCSYRYPYHRLATPMARECSNCKAHSPRYRRRTDVSERQSLVSVPVRASTVSGSCREAEDYYWSPLTAVA